MTSPRDEATKPSLLVLASTYPRWPADHEPGFVHELCKRLLPRFDITVVTPHSLGAKSRELFDGVRVVRYRYAPAALETLVHGGGMASHLKRSPWKAFLLPGFLLGQYLAARRELKQRKITAIHAHWLLPQGWVARSLAKRFRVPYLVTSHGGDLFGLRGRLLTQLKRRVATSAAAMSVVSSAMRDEVRRLDLNPPMIEVLPMGVDLRHRFLPDSSVVRDPSMLLFVGRLVPKKGLRHLLDAMPLVLAKHPGVRLDIAGFGPDQAGLQAQARALGIDASVNFLGAMPQQELPALYRRAALFVAPFVADDSGDQEGLPVALMEAIGCGCPAVVGDVAGVRDLLGDGGHDICVQPRDRVALAAAINSALENPEMAAQRAVMVRDVAADRVDWDRIANGYAALIDRCANAAEM